MRYRLAGDLFESDGPSVEIQSMEGGAESGREGEGWSGRVEQQ